MTAVHVLLSCPRKARELRYAVESFQYRTLLPLSCDIRFHRERSRREYHQGWEEHLVFQDEKYQSGLEARPLPRLPMQSFTGSRRLLFSTRRSRWVRLCHLRRCYRRQQQECSDGSCESQYLIQVGFCSFCSGGNWNWGITEFARNRVKCCLLSAYVD